ncbi:TauD/TfdA family dioxygenase [Streptomyces sp. 5-8]|uniref:TauD/TfdA family dioxygenase n=1 Tax=Streptomyces musisoli TaxID=2802280 RepID=A0ABS1P9V5_9ACTN|nr:MULTISPECIES: TauD/TfdA family dioxygenase [Streptomyces]MBL1108832.1 TauD/TfdA family dioxygenase [Streptomyces musisoli]MBY8842960.1 TauD/TfdA family dioxygenase [Streptomyces sp. SP2-10]
MTGGTPVLPVVVEGDGGPPAARLHADREALRAALRERGALLLRGFGVRGPDDFADAVRALSGEPLPYTERSSPRSVIKGNVYTSTDYPPGEEIFLHNENSYQASWPLTLYFHCVRPPQTRGATPLADTRRVLAAVDDEVREEFTRRGWMVVRNYGDLVGLPWQEAFGSDDRAHVERYCRERGITAQWLAGGALRTRAVRAAVHRHPATGEPVWFNHATVFHATTLPKHVRLGLLEMLGEENLPSQTYYGDGAAIPDDVLDHLRACYRGASTRFDYRTDDILVIDNMLVAHGREPFTGPRRIAVAMAEPHTGDR